jgi:ubiquinone/menaquinone biosynthesis C-methylase UbiE
VAIDFSRRSAEPEIIDDMTLDRETTASVLRELAVINRYLGGYSTTLGAVEDLAGSGAAPLRVLDVGAGGGDMARALVGWGRARARRVEVVSVDLSFSAVVYARERLADLPEASVVQADVLALPFADGAFDVAICALFLHHFEQPAVARILTALDRASRLGVVVNDLHRHPLAYAGIWLLTRLFPASAIVRNDGPLSVLRAFRRADFGELARMTGLRLEARWRWAFRWRVLVRKDA